MPDNDPIRAVHFGRIPIGLIHLDTERFRRYPGDELGVNRYNEAFAGSVVVWRDSADDKVYLVDGYRRYDLARKHNVGEMDVQWLDASSAVEAREFRREKNASLYSREPDSNTLVFESPQGAFGVSNEHGWAVKPAGAGWLYGDAATHHSGEPRFVANHWRLLDDDDPERTRLAVESILERPYVDRSRSHKQSSYAERLKEIQEVMDLSDQVEKDFPRDEGEPYREYQERIAPEFVRRLPRLPPRV
ncbi:MAG TPA: hypothetical protein VM053_06790 [Gemmatimonadaceae bacterium]|nr:hypothetical protein [Gemmatimonadaceae bacterium]